MDYTKYRECQIELACLIEDYRRELSALIDNLECKDRAVAEQAMDKLTNTFHGLCCIVSCATACNISRATNITFLRIIMDISSYFEHHRKVLNRIYHRKNYHPDNDKKFLKSRGTLYEATLYSLMQSKHILVVNDTYQLSVGGEQLRCALNQRFYETTLPIFISATAVALSAISVLLQLR